MKNIQKLLTVGFLLLAMCSALVLNISFNSSGGENNRVISLNFFEKNALAESESDCGVQDTEAFTKPKTGALCTCNGQVITPQSCEAGGDGCSPITCD